MGDEKNRLRKLWLAHLAKTRDARADALSRTLKTWIETREFDAVLATLPLSGEPDLTGFYEYWLSRGRLGLSRTDGRRLAFSLVTHLNGPWTRRPGGLREPTEGPSWLPGKSTLVLVPGLAFAPAPKGGVIRLGRGGGYYDRWLAEHRHEVTTLGVGFPGQLTDTLPREPHDILLDGYVDDEGFHGLEPK